ncbi:MAG: cysteine hydrolase [Azoarcus sp.]|jgi:nicotinamidase-related amidase|nr:cysteine hydrolase [Azoarcus sp.]
MTRKSIHLLIIDPQNDFCDLPETDRGDNTPALPVPGAHADMLRLAALIEQGGQGIANITVTFDSHHRLDIAHPGFWTNANGGPVAPFTQIHIGDVKAGAFRPRLAGVAPRVIAYLSALEAAGRYTHMVWPVHCELGAWGHNVHAAVRRAYHQWEDAAGVSVEKVLKGLNPLTEHYSAIRAEVPDPASIDTLTNNVLLDRLAAADTILIAGEAGSHCVKATVEHIVEYRPDTACRIVLLADCISPVSGFEDAQQAFIETMRSRGARIAVSTELLPELRANAV